MEVMVRGRAVRPPELRDISPRLGFYKFIDSKVP